METILHFLPLTQADQAAFRAAAPDARHVFLPTESRSRLHDIPADLLDDVTVILGCSLIRNLSRAGRLKWIQTWSAGVDAYLRPGVLPEGTALTSAVGCYGPAVSEHLLTLLLALWKRLPAYQAQQTAHVWADLGGVRSSLGSTVLVGGTGDIGTAFAQRMRALGAARIIGLRRRAGAPAEGFDETWGLDQLEHLLPQADVVALVLPRTADTDGLMDARRIARMKPDAVLLNAGRGTAVDGHALARALESGHLWGAGIDVTDPEPLPADHPLWSAPRCIITPHVAGIYNHMDYTLSAMKGLFLDNLRRYRTGEALRNRVR